MKLPTFYIVDNMPNEKELKDKYYFNKKEEKTFFQEYNDKNLIWRGLIIQAASDIYILRRKYYWVTILHELAHYFAFCAGCKLPGVTHKLIDKTWPSKIVNFFKL